MENFEKKYKEALRKASKIHRDDNGEIKHYMEVLFPELKDEDERIRKTIIRFFKDSYSNDTKMYDGFVTVGKAIAWLEKQGDTTKEVTCTQDVEVGNGNIKALVTEEMPIDKIEPKFHEGEWVIHQGTENIYQVIAVIGNQYQLKYGDNYTVQNSADVDRCARLWDITKDAKEGDVLYSPCLKLLWIFKSRDSIYCGSNLNYNDGAICVEGYFERPTDAIPATKEQRDTLERAITNAGYRWNKEELKLEKILSEKQGEQKPATSWHPADGDYLPEIDRSVIVLLQRYPLEENEYAVSFAHRTQESITTGEKTYYPERYGKAGWNTPNVKWWLDLNLPTNKQENENKK